MKAFICTLLLLCLGGSVFGMEIARDGEPKAVIVLGTDVPRMVEYAASELRDYVKKISGAELRIAREVPADAANLIFVGESEYTRKRGLSLDGLSADGFRVVARDNWLALLGRDYKGKVMQANQHPFRLKQSYDPRTGINRMGETGTLFAVYAFLEDSCGVRWFMPGELGEVVPPANTISIKDTAYSREPDFAYRFVYTMVDFNKDEATARWYRRAGFGAQFSVWIIHSFNRLRHKYAKTNPEYFALIDGKRDFRISCQGQGNLCLTEPGTLQAFVHEARAYFDKNPEQFTYPVMPMDSFIRVCDCPKCQAQVEPAMGNQGHFSKHVWTFVNNVAKEVYKTHPDKQIGCCAYGAYLKVPKGIEFSPNVVVMICKTRSTYWNPEAEARKKQLIDQWRSKVKRIYIWEYYLWARSPGYKNVPVFFPHIIARDLRYLKGAGSGGEFIEVEGSFHNRAGETTFPGLTHLGIYVTAKLQWDVNRDMDALLEDYYEKFYGPGSAEMKAFWSTVEEIWTKDSPERKSVSSQAQIYDVLYTEQAIEGLLQHLDAALAKTAVGSAERKRVELVRSEFVPLRERQRQGRGNRKPTYQCSRTDAAPVIDGVLDDACWKRAIPLRFVDKSGDKAKHGTEFRLAWDKDNLYLAFVNQEPDVSKMRVKVKKRDHTVPRPYIWDDDCIEIFLDPHRVSEKTYYQIIVNAAGTTWDAYHISQTGINRFDLAWNGNVRVKSLIGKKQWVLEAAVPLKSLGVLKPEVGKRFAANFYRTRIRGIDKQHDSSTGWSPVYSFNHHIPSRFGILVLAK